jgi:transcriptional antiterminator NusG
MKWYVVQVVTGKERDIRDSILKQGIKAIVPEKRMRERKQGKWHEAIKVIFPSYVFLVADMEACIYYKIKAVTGIIKVLKDDSGPVPIMDDEINLILRLTQDGTPLGLSEVFVEGSKITVTSGPLEGLEGKIIKLDARRFRAKVNVSFMGDIRVVELPVNVIKKSEA